MLKTVDRSLSSGTALICHVPNGYQAVEALLTPEQYEEAIQPCVTDERGNVEYTMGIAVRVGASIFTIYEAFRTWKIGGFTGIFNDVPYSEEDLNTLLAMFQGAYDDYMDLRG